MVVKNFYLLGRNPAEAINVHGVEIDITHDLAAAQTHVADAFSIVDPKSVGFQTQDKQALTDLDALLDADQPVAVNIDGHAVREVPSAAGLPIVGTYFQVYPDHIGNHLRMFDRLGSTFVETSMGKTTYLTCDPAIVAHVFQESPFWTKIITPNHPLYGAKDNKAGLFIADTNTEAWRLAHKYLPPALSPRAVRKYTPMMQEKAEMSFKVFDYFADNSEAFNIFTYMFKLTSEAVAKLVMNVDLQQFDTPDAPLHGMVSDVLQFLALNKKVSEKGAWYAHLPFGDPKRLRNIQDSLQQQTGSAFLAAKARGGSDLPIATAALEADSIIDFVARAVDENGNKMPVDDALGALPILIGAGFATTATLMSWMFYCAAEFPGVQDKLYQELIDHGATAETKWNFDTVNELPYLDKFIKEVQRLYNPAFQPGRTSLREQILPGGYHIPKDAVMIVALHALHRNPVFWDDPTAFNPDRWDSEKVKKRPTSVYTPFATGPRSCIGFNFALQEAKTIFSTLLMRYTISRYGDSAVAYDPEQTIFMPLDLYIQIKKRV